MIKLTEIVLVCCSCFFLHIYLYLINWDVKQMIANSKLLNWANYIQPMKIIKCPKTKNYQH